MKRFKKSGFRRRRKTYRKRPRVMGTYNPSRGGIRL